MAIEIKNHFGPEMDFTWVDFSNSDLIAQLRQSQIELRDQLNMSELITQLDLTILHKLDEEREKTEHILIPGYEFPNKDTVCVRREEIIESYSKRGIEMEFVLAPLPKPGEKVTYFRFGINIDVSYYIKFKRA